MDGGNPVVKDTKFIKQGNLTPDCCLSVCLYVKSIYPIYSYNTYSRLYCLFVLFIGACTFDL